MRRNIPSLALLLVAVLALSPITALALDDGGALPSLETEGSLLVPGPDERILATLTLVRPTDLRLRVVDFDGRTVRELYRGPRAAGELRRGWFGRDDDGTPVPNGPYRLVATATTDGAIEKAEAWVTVADRAVYPKAPGFITVAVDPGHGGDFDGAVASDGTREADLNLDIGLRLARMLEGAGVNVVITRTTDGHVNEPPQDRTADDVIDGDDELAARPDLANGARADLFLSIHNNIAVNKSVGGPSTFFYDERPFAARNARLAQIVQGEMVTALADVANGSWEPYDHGTLVYPYYVLRGFDPPRLRRPTQMPGVLSEGMFLSNSRELRLLKRPAVRGAMAAAYYEAISKYLARRGHHVGYEVLEGPDEANAGADLRYSIEVRNQGTETLRGWLLKVNAVKAPSRYVSRIRDAVAVGERDIPRLEPGERRVLEVDVAAPDADGEWTLLFDARDRGGTRAGEIGSPMLQVPLKVVESGQE
jgi:N-acetylmuramoyl-L-alanine amidase